MSQGVPLPSCYVRGSFSTRADPRFFLGGCTRLLLYFNTNKRHSFFFFCRIPVELENRRSSQGGCASPAPSPQIRPCCNSPILRVANPIFLCNSYVQTRGGTLGISGWGCAAGTLEPLNYTRASSAEFCYPILD